jgi:hypothetical protein
MLCERKKTGPENDFSRDCRAKAFAVQPWTSRRFRAEPFSKGNKMLTKIFAATLPASTLTLAPFAALAEPAVPPAEPAPMEQHHHRGDGDHHHHHHHHHDHDNHGHD